MSNEGRKYTAADLKRIRLNAKMRGFPEMKPSRSKITPLLRAIADGLEYFLRKEVVYDYVWGDSVRGPRAIVKEDPVAKGLADNLRDARKKT
jgi:hypothetical protein